jgi:hypothetical protein
MKARPFLAVLLAALLTLFGLGGSGWWLVWRDSPLQLQRQLAAVPRAALFVPRQADLALYVLSDGRKPVAYARAVAPLAQRKQAVDAISRLRDGAFAAAGLDYEAELSNWLAAPIVLALFEPSQPTAAGLEAAPGWLLALGSRDNGGARRFLQRFWQTRSLAGTDLQVSRYRGKGLISGRGALGGRQPLPLATALIDDDLVLIASGRPILEQALDVSQIAVLNQAALPELQQAPQRFGPSAALLVAQAPALERWLGLPSLAGGRLFEAVAAPPPLGGPTPAPPATAGMSPGAAPGGASLPMAAPTRADSLAGEGDRVRPEAARATSLGARSLRAKSLGAVSAAGSPPAVSTAAEPGPPSATPPAPAPTPLGTSPGSSPRQPAAEVEPQAGEPPDPGTAKADGLLSATSPTRALPDLAAPRAAERVAGEAPTAAAADVAARDVAARDVAADVAARDVEAMDVAARDVAAVDMKAVDVEAADEAAADVAAADAPAADNGDDDNDGGEDNDSGDDSGDEDDERLGQEQANDQPSTAPDRNGATPPASNPAGPGTAEPVTGAPVTPEARSRTANPAAARSPLPEPGAANFAKASAVQPARLALPAGRPWSPGANTPAGGVADSVVAGAQAWPRWLGAATPAFAAAPASSPRASGSARQPALAAQANPDPSALDAAASRAAVPPSRRLVLALRPEGRDLLLQADLDLGGPLPLLRGAGSGALSGAVSGAVGSEASDEANGSANGDESGNGDGDGSGDEALRQGLLAGLRGPIHSLALLHNPAAWRQLLPLRPWFDQLFAGRGAGPLPALVAAADTDLLVAAEGPFGWQLGTLAENPPLRSLEAPLAAMGLIAAPLEQGDRSLLVWTRLQVNPSRSARQGADQADQLQATLAGWWSRDEQLAWWGRSLAQLRQKPSSPERLRQLEALARPLAPLQWALDGPAARSLLGDWQPWRLLTALAGGGLEGSISGLAVAAEPSSMGLALQARLELG